MSQMKEMYEKVANDTMLQEKFNAILKEGEEVGQEATTTKLVAFAKEAGFDISIQEMQGFFAELTTQQDGKLSDLELDMVAGGKSTHGSMMIAFSVFYLVLGVP